MTMPAVMAKDTAAVNNNKSAESNHIAGSNVAAAGRRHDKPSLQPKYPSDITEELSKTVDGDELDDAAVRQSPSAAAGSVVDRLRRRCTLPLFVANVSALLLFWMVNAVYTGGVVRTLERRFGLRSTQTGLIMSCNDVTHTCIVVFVGYFARRANKPRILSFTALFSALASLLMASPHWLFDAPAFHAAAAASYAHNSSVNSSLSKHQFCAASLTNFDNSTSESCDGQTFQRAQQTSSYSVHPAFYIFIIAQLFNGIGGSGIHTLSLAYIDENASKVKSSLYVGVVTSMYAFGPVCGLMLAAIALRLPENLTLPTQDTPDDPSWIGCWWLGYLLCSIGILVSAGPLYMFPTSFVKNKKPQTIPPRLADGEQKMALTARSSSGSKLMTSSTKETSKLSIFASFMKQLKEFPASLLHLLRNKAYLVNLGSIICGAYVIMGIFVNMVRYIEIHFHQQAFIASSISALVSAFAGAVGGFAGGLLMSRLRLKPPGAVKMILVSTSVFTLGMTVVLFLDCPQIQFAANVDPLTDKLSVHDECNRDCACATDRKSYSPVCGNDNLTYFSSCFAGCTRFVNGSFGDCRCVSKYSSAASQSFSTSSPAAGNSFLGTARPGYCLPTCNLIIPYAVAMFVASIVGSFSRVPSTIVNFRVVDDDERSFALVLNSFIVNLLGFIPAPLLFGTLIDSSCRLWQQTASPSSVSSPACGPTATTETVRRGRGGGSGSCLLFDTTKFRQRTYGVAVGVEIIEILLVIVLYRLIRKKEFAASGTTAENSEHPDDKVDGKSPEVLDIIETNV